jgi:hypothetical protein
LHPARQELRAAEMLHFQQKGLLQRAALSELVWARPMARVSPEEIQLLAREYSGARQRSDWELVVHPALARAKRQSPRAKRRMRLQTQGG